MAQMVTHLQLDAQHGLGAFGLGLWALEAQHGLDSSIWLTFI